MTGFTDEYAEPNYLYYINDVKSFPVLSIQEEYDLMERIRQGDKEAYNYFYSCNLKWALKIAKQYQGYGVPLMDLIQAGNMGLMRAVEKFDHTKGLKFSTYSNAWVHQFISRLLRQKGLVWTPEYIVLQIKKMRKAESQLGDHATDEQIAALAKLPVERIADLRNWSMDTVSFDAIVGDEDGDDVALRIESALSNEKDASEAQRISEQHELRAEIDRAMAMLTTREREIVKLRYGLDDRGEQTLETVGKEFRVTRERVRQVEVVALRKLQPLLADVARRMGAAV